MKNIMMALVGLVLWTAPALAEECTERRTVLTPHIWELKEDGESVKHAPDRIFDNMAQCLDLALTWAYSFPRADLYYVGCYGVEAIRINQENCQ